VHNYEYIAAITGKCAHIYADAEHVGASNLSCVCELIGQGLRKMNEPIIVTNGEFLSNGLDNVEV